MISFFNILNPKRMLQIAIAAAVVGSLVWSHYKMYQYGRDKVMLVVNKKANEELERARKQTQELQEKLNAAQNDYASAKNEIRSSSRRIDDLVSRLRYKAPTAEQLVIYSSPTLSEYATSLERDFAECRAEYATLGVVAADASAAAHTLKDGWPEIK